MSISQVDLRQTRLPIQPQIISALMQLTDDSEVGFRDLEKIIKADENISTLILKAANSPLYSRGKEIRSIQIAISLLGFRVIRTLATVASSQGMFQSGNYARFRKYVSEHAVITGVIARSIAVKLKLKNLEEDAFVGGLLHDLGKVIMNSLDRSHYIEVIHLVERGVPFSQAEKQIFGFSHRDIGEKAAMTWNLPQIYRWILSTHGLDALTLPEGMDESSRALVQIVACANYLARLYGYGAPLSGIEHEISKFFDALGMDSDTRSFYLSEFRENIPKDEFYNFFITIL